MQLRLIGFDFGTTTSSAVAATGKLGYNCVTRRQEITDIDEIYRSPVVFTPYDGQLIDNAQIADYVDTWLAESGGSPETIVAGGAIVTGLAAQASNAAALAALIRGRIPQCLIASTDDPGLESWLAFMGNCLALSRAEPQTPILNLDIGGGTTNLAYGRGGMVSHVGCYFIGARHFRFEPGGYKIAGLSSFAERLLADLKIRTGIGERLAADEVQAIVDAYVETLEALVCGDQAILNREGIRSSEQLPFGATVSRESIITLSGGVGELVYSLARQQPLPGTTAFGDLGVDLALGIWRSPILARDLARHMPAGLGRATVYGLALHSSEVSGATLFMPRPELLPLRDVPIVGHLTGQSGPHEICSALELAARGCRAACLGVQCASDDVHVLRELGRQLADALSLFPHDRVLVLLVAQNVGKTLGQYATKWGQLPVNLVVIDEIAARDAAFVSISSLCGNSVLVSLYGLGAAREVTK